MNFLRLMVCVMLPTIAINNGYTMNYNNNINNTEQIITDNKKIEDVLGPGIKIEPPDIDTLQYIFGEECTNNNCEVTAYFRAKYDKNLHCTIELNLLSNNNAKANLCIKNGNFYLPQNIEQALQHNKPYATDNRRSCHYAEVKLKCQNNVKYYLACYDKDLHDENKVIWNLLDDDYYLNICGETKTELLSTTDKSSIFKLLNLVSKNIQLGVSNSNYDTKIPIFDFAYNKYGARTFLQSCINNINNEEYINTFVNRYRIKYYQDANGHPLSIEQLILDIDYFCQIYPILIYIEL